MTELMDYDEAARRFDPVLGIEVHVELGTKTKMFDAAPNAFGGDPEHLRDPRVAGSARLPAGRQPQGRRVRDQDRPGPELRDCGVLPFRA